MNLKRMSASGGMDLRTRDLTAEARPVVDLGAAVLTDVRPARTAGHGTSWHIRTAMSSAWWPRPTPTGRGH